MPKSVEYSHEALTTDLRLRNLIKKLRAVDNLIHRYVIRRGIFIVTEEKNAMENITSRCLYPRFYRLLSGAEPFPMKENHPITDRRLSFGSFGSLG